MNSNATIFPKVDQIVNEPDVLFTYVGDDPYYGKRDGDWTSEVKNDFPLRHITNTFAEGIYFSKNIPFASCKITNLYMLGKTTNLTDSSFKTMLQVSTRNNLHSNSLTNTNKLALVQDNANEINKLVLNSNYQMTKQIITEQSNARTYDYICSFDVEDDIGIAYF
jgi:hypothetical protein